MEDRVEEAEANSPRGYRHGKSEQHQQQQAVRSRWTPKPEQILILESIFNSGMVNPPKDETVRIRKLLEKFGSVGDANVFYWFQNRRSRSRRRQRQIQAGLLTSNTTSSSNSSKSNIGDQSQPMPIQAAAAAAFMFDRYEQPQPQRPTSSVNDCFASSLNSSSCLVGSSSATTTTSGDNSNGNCAADDNLFSFSQQMDLRDIHHHHHHSSSVFLCPTGIPNLHYQSGAQTNIISAAGGGCITVYINGVATEVPRGPFNIAAMFGGVGGAGGGVQDLILLVHSSGVPVPVDECGVVMLQMGESYFLVSGPT